MANRRYRSLGWLLAVIIIVPTTSAASCSIFRSADDGAKMNNTTKTGLGGATGGSGTCTLFCDRDGS